MLDAIIWWTGAVVLSAGALLAVGAIAAGAATIGVVLATRAAFKCGHTLVNLKDMRAWRKAGRPKWTRVGDGFSMEMRPTDTAP